MTTIPKRDDPPPRTLQPKKDDREPWDFDIFGCLDDWRLCIATFFCPCYTLGKNALAMGEDGGVVGCLCCLGLVGFLPVMRWRIREEKKVLGNMVSDVVLTMFCTCCALIQENKQLYGLKGSHFGERIPLNQNQQQQEQEPIQRE